MAHVDLVPVAAPARRPAALSPTHRAMQRQNEEPARPRQPLASFCRINAGQLARTLFLVLLCVGVSRIPQPEKLAPKATVAAPSLRPF